MDGLGLYKKKLLSHGSFKGRWNPVSESVTTELNTWVTEHIE